MLLDAVAGGAGQNGGEPPVGDVRVNDGEGNDEGDATAKFAQALATVADQVAKLAGVPIGQVPVSSGNGVGASAATMPHGKSLPPPAKWTDSESEKRKPATFLADARDWLLRNKYDPAAHFHMVLDGKFREQWEVIRQQYKAGPPMTWDDVRTEFYGLTGADLIDEKRIARDKLFGGHVKMTGTMQAYVVDMRALRNELTNLPEDTWVYWFINGLTPALKAQCSVNPITNKPWATMAEAVAYAVGQYDKMRAAGMAVPSTKLAGAVRSGVSPSSQGLLRSAADIYGSGTVAAGMGSSRAGGSGAGGLPPQPSMFDAKAWRTYCFQHNLCLDCAEPGHRKGAADCDPVKQVELFKRHMARQHGKGGAGPSHGHKRPSGGRGGGSAGGRGGKVQRRDG
jgi:hypothetical protein